MKSKASPGAAFSAAPSSNDVRLHSFRSPSRKESPTSLLPSSLLRVSRWKLFEYCREQPATTLFLLSLILLTVCTPLLSLYIQHYGHQLPDLDTMKVWNGFLGKLPSKQFCSVNSTGGVQAVGCGNCTSESYHTVGVVVEFLVGVELLELGVSAIVGDFSGKDFKTKIKDSSTHERIDGNISYSVFINLEGDNCDEESYCHFNGCVLITSPDSATGFNQLFDSSNFPLRPSPDCLCSLSDINHNQTESSVKRLFLMGSDTCTGVTMSVKLAKEKYSRHGLVLIFLSEDDLKMAGSRLYLATTFLLGLALAFIIGISCTERHKTVLIAHSK